MEKVDRNLLRQSVQDMAYRAWENAGRRGTIVMATGVGKSKLAIKRVQAIYDDTSALDLPVPGDNRPSVLLVTPTEKLRDENWPDEFEKWRAEEAMVIVKRICFASLKNEKGNKYKLVILDEGHRITSHNAEGFLEEGTLTQFLADNVCEEVMALTATEPDKDRDMMKHHILNSIAPVCFRYSLDQAVEDGILPPYQIVVIMVPLERTLKEIPAGRKDAPFMTSEQAAHEFLLKKLVKAHGALRKNPNSKWAQTIYGERRRFFCNLPSKTRIAEKVIKRVVHEQKKRTLIFCGSIEQSRKLCGENVYNSSAEDKKRDMLSDFKKKLIHYLGVVDGVNEGHNIEDIEQGIAVQLNSNERDFIQRLGRLLRGEDPVFYVIVSQGTQDEKWMREALADIDPKRIRYDSHLNYVM